MCFVRRWNSGMLAKTIDLWMHFCRYWPGRRACGNPPGTLDIFECLPVVQGFLILAWMRCLYFLLRIGRLLNTRLRVDLADRYPNTSTLSSVSVNLSPRNVLDVSLSVVLDPIPFLMLHWPIH